MFMLWNSSIAFFLINQSTTVCLLEQISLHLSYYFFTVLTIFVKFTNVKSSKINVSQWKPLEYLLSIP